MGDIKSPVDSFDGIEQIITEECRAYIENHYRVRRDKWGRAIAGLSLGSMTASYIGFRHPALYSAIGVFSGFLRRREIREEIRTDRENARELLRSIRDEAKEHIEERRATFWQYMDRYL